MLTDAATVQAAEMRGVWVVFCLAAIGVYAIVGGLILWSAVAYRRRGADVVQAASFANNAPLEIAWTVLPILIVAGLFLVSVPAETHVESLARSPGEVVHVVGFRWSWRFLYPGEHVAVNGSSTAPPELVLPSGTTTRVQLTSSDVIHAFWVPAFLFKRDAVPGMATLFDLTPRKPGVYPGRCAEYCGTFHAHMSFTVRVVPPAEFARWIRERQAT